MMFNNFTEMVGNTPIVRFGKYKKAEIFLKLEGSNPTGSLKDRSALNIIKDMTKKGELESGKIILDASSGSFGCALAFFGRLAGFPVTVVANSKITQQNVAFLKMCGAEIIHHGEVTREGYEYCLDLIEKYPDKYCFANQLNNWASPEAHYKGTGPEILKDLPDVTAVAASMGSGATLHGVSSYLKNAGSKAIIIASAAKPGKKIAGTFSEGTDYVSPFIEALWRNNSIDFTGTVSYDEAVGSAKKLFDKGFFVGLQTGGVFKVVIDAIDTLDLKGKIVIISGDNGWKNIDKLSS